MLNLNTLAVDPKLAIEGTWAPFAGGRFLIARHNNPASENLRNALFMTGDNMKVIQEGGDAADKVITAIEVEVMARTILLDWESVGESEDKPLEYTPELGIKFLSDERFRDLFKFIENYSLNRGNYREKAEAKTTKAVKTTAAS